MNRRDFLRLSLAGAAGLAASACTRSPRIPADVPAAVRAAAMQEAQRGALSGLQVFPGGLEFVAGRTQRFPFGLVDPDGASIDGGEARLWAAAADGEPGAATTARYHQYRTTVLPGDPVGFYVTTIEVPPPGLVDLLVAVRQDDRSLYGWTTVEARARAGAVDVRDQAVAVATPTTADPRGVANVCTRAPPCPLHDRPLDRVLEDRRPVVFTIASPLLCTSRTCGPVLEEVLEVRARAGARARFVHAEPYRGQTATNLAETAQAWRLESEPWTFVIGPDGVVRARFEGPVVADEIHAALLPLL